MLLSQNKSSLTRLLLFSDPKRNCNVNAFIHSSAIEFMLSLEKSIDCYLMLFFSFSNSFCIWFPGFSFSALLSLIFSYFLGVCNFLHLVLLAISFVVINFLFSSILVTSMCKYVASSNRRKK